MNIYKNARTCPRSRALPVRRVSLVQRGRSDQNPESPRIFGSGPFGVLPYIHRVGCRFTGEGGRVSPGGEKGTEFEGNFFGGWPEEAEGRNSSETLGQLEPAGPGVRGEIAGLADETGKNMFGGRAVAISICRHGFGMPLDSQDKPA